MWYTIILLSICLAVAVVFWIRADRMTGHYRREALAATDEDLRACRADNSGDGSVVEIFDSRSNEIAGYQFDGVNWHRVKGKSPVTLRAECERLGAELTTTRRKLAAAKGRITKLRKRLGDQ